MAARQQEKELRARDIRELEGALTVAKLACRRIQNKVAYAGSMYDAAGEVIHAIDEMARETR